MNQVHLLNIVEAMADSLIVVDPTGLVARANQATFALLGYSEDELIGQPLETVFPEEESGLHSTHRNAIRPGAPMHKTEAKYKARDGTIIPVSISGSAMLDPETGALMGIVVVARDIRVEQENRRMRELLREQEAQTQTAVAEKKLAEAKAAHMEEVSKANKELSRVNRELALFADVASHDMQSPLRTMESFVSLLQCSMSHEREPKVQQYITRIAEGCVRLRTMIAGILAYAGAADSLPVWESLDTRALIQTVVDDLAETIAARRAVVKVGQAPPVHGDGAQLRRVFQNLIENACQFCGPSPPMIQIECEERDDEWVCSVQDNGIGMDSATTGEAFQIFRQLHDTDRSGSGIGLSICAKIVKRHGGKIWIESELGSGTTCYFSLPIRPSTIEVSAYDIAPVEPTAAIEPANDKQGPMRILVVDDDPTTRELFQILFEMGTTHPGGILEEASSGRQALEMRAAQRYDLIILDQKMPGMNGVETAMAMRAMEDAGSCERAVIVGVSSCDLPQMQKDCLAAGMDDFVVKDFTIEAFDELVSKYSART